MAYASRLKIGRPQGLEGSTPSIHRGPAIEHCRRQATLMPPPCRATPAIGYPQSATPLVAVIDDPAEAAAAMAELTAAGIPTRDLDVLRGAEGADRMDGTGAVSGWLGRLRRAFDFTLMDQLVDFAAYERALRDGRAVVMVHVHGDAPKARPTRS